MYMRLIIYHVLGAGESPEVLGDVVLSQSDIFLGYDLAGEIEEVKEDRYIPFHPSNTTYSHLIMAIVKFIDVLDPPCLAVLNDRDTI
jgi:hypothetical protein